MSQKDQEAAIDERIERIRKRNEEIQRRYLEVEADKLNAEKLNAAVKFSPSPAKNPDPERKNYSRPEPINRNPRVERKVPDKPYVPKHQVHGKKTSFADNDGPPPDPVYTFLSDSSRDVPRYDHDSDEKATNENFSGDEFRGYRGGGRGRGWSRGRGSLGRGGKRGTGNQPSRQSPQMQPDYEAWRAEREKIDQDRITRQKTAEGNWRREWDMKKLSQDENQEFQSRPAFTKKKRRDSDELKLQRTIVNELASPPMKDQEGKSYEKSSLAKSGNRGSAGEKKTVVFKVNEGPPPENDDIESEESSFEHRKILSCGDSIKISLSNKPIKSVKVNPMNSAGTGRVGPRQKPRLSYSSQSEDEKEMLAPMLRKRSHGIHSDQSISVPVDAYKKPPLPPRGNNSSPKKQVPVKTSPSTSKESESPTSEGIELSRGSSHENISEPGDDSWEDVATTSGNESADFSDADVSKKSNNGDEFEGRELKKDDETQEENVEETREQQDETTGKEEYLDNVVISQEVEVVAKEKESGSDESYKKEEVKTSEDEDQKKPAVFSGEEIHQEITSCSDGDNIENPKVSIEVYMKENVENSDISVKDVSKEVVVIKERHSPEEEKDDLEHQGTNIESDLKKNDCEANDTEKNEKLKTHGNVILPDTGNKIDGSAESCPKNESEGIDIPQVRSENDSQPVTKLEET